MRREYQEFQNHERKLGLIRSGLRESYPGWICLRLHAWLVSFPSGESVRFVPETIPANRFQKAAFYWGIENCWKMITAAIEELLRFTANPEEAVKSRARS
jgi:hypothetical protein